MSISDSCLSCAIDGLTPEIREEDRIAAIKLLDLLSVSSVPVLEQTTQMVARFLNTPICVITLVVDQQVRIKSSYGLSCIYPHPTLQRNQSLCTYVVDSQQPLCLEDISTNSFLSNTIPVRQWGVLAYLGVPLVSQGQCIGTLAVMNLQPFSFTQECLDYLQLVSRWSLQEMEINCLKKAIIAQSFDIQSTRHLQVLQQFGEELRNPLTSILGMTSILIQGIFGNLTIRQTEYLSIVHTSSQNLNTLLDELLNLTNALVNSNTINLSLVNLEMLCQKVIKGVSPIAERKSLTIHCSAENVDMILPLDQCKIRQALCYLMFAVVSSSPSHTEISIHLGRSQQGATIFINFPSLEACSQNLESHSFLAAGVKLSNALINLHGGILVIERLLNNAENFYDRYVISLPRLNYN